MKRYLFLFTLVSSGLISACQSKPVVPEPEPRASSPAVRFDRQVDYGDAKDVELVTNEFGSTDLQLISEKMVSSLLEAGVFQDRPTVTIAPIKNKTSEYIDTSNVMNSIQTQLVKSGKVRFTRSIQEMQTAVDELQRQNQSGLYKEGTTSKVGQMTAAKYSLEVELTSIVKRNQSTKDVYYKFTLKMFNIEEGVVEWQDEKEIRKTSR